MAKSFAMSVEDSLDSIISQYVLANSRSSRTSTCVTDDLFEFSPSMAGSDETLTRR
jgi:hypothetical protein